MSRSPLGGQPLSTALDHLVEALRALPGVGPKAASRMAFHLLEHDRAAARHLAQQLMHALEAVRHCESCNTFCDDALCAVCADPDRERAQLCVVESVADMSAMERVGSYKGLYFVLMGSLSPLDGIGPKDIHLDRLIARASVLAAMPVFSSAMRHRICNATWRAVTAVTPLRSSTQARSYLALCLTRPTKLATRQTSTNNKV